MKNKTCLAIIFAFAVVLYGWTLSFGYTYYEDNLVHEKAFQNPPLSYFVETIESWNFYFRPLQNMLFSINTHLSGDLDVPWLFHLTNVLLFALIGCALFRFLTQQKLRPKIAFWVSMIFCSHPLFVTPVAWIPACGDLLVTLFSLLAMISFVNYLERDYRWKDLVLTTLFVLLALFSKETAVALPLVFLAYFWFNSSDRKLRKPHWLLAVALGAVGVLWVWLRSSMTSEWPLSYTLAERLYYVLNIPTALSLMVFPFQPETMSYFSGFKTLSGSVILGLLAVLLWTSEKIAKPIKKVSIVWFLGFLLPCFIGIPGSGCEYLAHRFLLPAVAVFWLLATLANEAIAEEQHHRFRQGAIGLIAVFSLFTIVFSRHYASPESFHAAAIKANPQNEIALTNRGYYRSLHNNMPGAEADLLASLRLQPNNYGALMNVAAVKKELGKVDEALAYYNLILSLHPNDLNAYFRRAVVKIELGDFYGALEDLEVVLHHQPNNEYVRHGRDNLLSFLQEHQISP